MLLELRIADFAIIDSLQVQFAPGLTVLTGETGAGKSILIDAISLILGARARIEAVRHGCDTATVEARFELSRDPAVQELLEEMGIASEGELCIRRLLNRSGKNRLYLNGAMAGLNQLQQLAPYLVSIFGQHAYQALQRSEKHLELLDRHGELHPELDRYGQAYRRWQELDEKLRRLATDARSRMERLDLLSFQYQELCDAKLRAGEEADLFQERARLQHAEKLGNATQGGFERLYGADGAVVESLDGLAAELEQLSRYDSQLSGLAESVRSAQFSLEDVAQSLRSYGEELVVDPGRLDEVESRLALLERLKRKYALDSAELIERRDAMEAEIEELRDAEGGSEKLRAEVDRAFAEVLSSGETLRLRRRETAEALCEAVRRELCDLAMERTRLEFRFEELSAPSTSGLDSGELYFSANPGEALLPLAKVASGGELSRLMLALRRVAPEQQMAASLIFDEVDAGVGGTTATAIGEKLRQVASEAQVFCVTHLPQVAAFADQHIKVEKEVTQGRTRTRLLSLEAEARVEEMARLLGGAHRSENTLAHARELVNRCTTP